MKILEIPLSRIKPDPNQPRKTFNPDKIQELAQTIKTTGIINPIEVDSSYMIITGENRYRAAKVAGLTKVWVKILDIDDKDRFIRQVIENIQYANLTPFEIANALKLLLDRLPGKRSRYNDQGMHELAKQLGKSAAWISQHLALLAVSPQLRKAIKSGLEIRNLRAIKLAPTEHQAEMEKQILAGNFVSANAAEQVAQALNRAPEKAKEIMKTDFSKYKNASEMGEAMAKIAPRLSDVISAGQPPYDQIQAIARELFAWTAKTTPEQIGQLRLKGVLVTLASMKSAIDEWVIDKKALPTNVKRLKS